MVPKIMTVAEIIMAVLDRRQYCLFEWIVLPNQAGRKFVAVFLAFLWILQIKCVQKG